QDCVTRGAGEQSLQRFGEARQVALDKLALQRDRRGGNHYRTIGFNGACNRRHKIGKGLAGTRAGLYGEMLAYVKGLRDGLGHRDLSGPLVAAKSVDGSGQKVGHCGGWRGPSLIILVGIAGSPAERCKPAKGRLFSAAETRARTVERSSAESGSPLRTNGTVRVRLDSLVAGGRPAG